MEKRRLLTLKLAVQPPGGNGRPCPLLRVGAEVESRRQLVRVGVSETGGVVGFHRLQNPADVTAELFLILIGFPHEIQHLAGGQGDEFVPVGYRAVVLQGQLHPRRRTAVTVLR